MTGPDRESVREAFSVLAHDLRLDILLALLADWEAARTEPKSYAELMDAVGLEDSGRFNYHLEQLRGVYVEQVDDGYVPTASATALYRAVLAHRPTDDHDVNARSAVDDDRSISIDDECPRCGGSLDARYERQFLSVDCRDCGEVLFTYPFPANGLGDRSGRDAVRAVQQRSSHEIALAATGQCPFCAARTSISFDRSTFDGDDPIVSITCTCCSAVLSVPLRTPLRHDPAVAAALADVGAVPDDAALGGGSAVSARIRSDDPLRAVLEIDGDRGTATIVVDGDLDVRSVDVESIETD